MDVHVARAPWAEAAGRDREASPPAALRARADVRKHALDWHKGAVRADQRLLVLNKVKWVLLEALLREWLVRRAEAICVCGGQNAVLHAI